MQSAYKLRSLATFLVLSLSASTQAGVMGYAVRSNENDHLYAINMITGEATDLGPVAFDDAEGLAIADGRLYAVGGTVNEFWDITVPPGFMVGPTGNRSGSDAGLDFNRVSSRMYNDNDGSLYEINITTGGATLIGAAGQHADGLAISGMGQAFVADFLFSDALYELSLGSSGTTLVGEFGAGDVFAQCGLSFDGDDNLWALSSDGDLWRIDTSTGKATIHATVTEGGVPLTGFEGLAILHTPCLGDVTGDGLIGVTDLLVLLGGWGNCPLTFPAEGVVVPNASEPREQTGSNRFPFLVDGGMRYQQLYHASQFPSSTGSRLITQIAFRPDGISGGPFDVDISDLEIRLSTSPVEPDGLSATFANNHGPDELLVRDGPVTLSSNYDPGPGDTKAFDIVIDLPIPFRYHPDDGNLLLDIRNNHAGNNDIGVFLDGALREYDSVSRVFSFEGDPGAPTGVPVTLGLATRFTSAPISVAPNANEEVDANVLNRFPIFVNGGMRYQQVHDASEFASLGGPRLITQIAFRLDNLNGDAFVIVIDEIEIHLDTIAAGPDELSSGFAANIGPGNVTVYAGPLTLHSVDRSGPGNTRDFDIVIDLQTPYFYDPSAGNLLLDILNAHEGDNGTPSNSMDAVSMAGDGVSRVYGAEGDDTAVFGSTDTAGLVVRFLHAEGSCPGDVDGDGLVSTTDLLILLGGWGSCL